MLLAEEAIDGGVKRLRMGEIVVQEPIRPQLLHKQLNQSGQVAPDTLA